ncbi:MAG: TraX family protein [Pseudomonadota bacterium]
MTPESRNTWIPWGQWLAVGAMTLEHLARFVLPEASPLTPWAILLGRIALPLFAAMVAWHAVHNTRDPLGYALRMLVIAVIAQLPFALVTGSDKLNIIFTLALGLLLAVPLARSDRVAFTLALVIATLSPLVAGSLEYGIPGLLLVPAFALAFQPAPDHWRPILSVPAALVAFQLNPGLVLNLVSLATVLGLLVLLVHFSGHVTNRVTPMPRPLWLSWYPLHFAVIAAIQPFTTVLG